MSNFASLKLPPPPAKRRRIPSPLQYQTCSAPPPDTPAGIPSDEDLAEELQAPGALPIDALAALYLLKARFPAEAKVVPFATKVQLYTVLADRTAADRQLEELRRRNAVRLLQLPASRDECVVVLTADYLAAVESCKAAVAAAAAAATGAAERAPPPEAAQAFDWFAARVLPACTEVLLTHEELLQLLAGQATRGDGRQEQRRRAPDAAAERHVSLLLGQGLLTRLTSGPDGYLFSLPNAGLAVRSVAAGRQELLAVLRRRRQPEMLEAELLKRRLQRSVLGPRWHVADMLGSGALLRVHTAVGPLLRAAKRAG